MKKEWNAPEVNDLSVVATEMNPNSHVNVDRTFVDDNNNLWETRS